MFNVQAPHPAFGQPLPVGEDMLARALSQPERVAEGRVRGSPRMGIEN